jgi:uncharacterized membrane protein YebE (DUF533 family)
MRTYLSATPSRKVFTMLDAKRLLDQFLGAPGGFSEPFNRDGRSPGGSPLDELTRNIPAGLGGIGGGALAGGLAGILLGSKSGRKLGATALRMGSMAAIGALAYHAYQNWQAGREPTATGSEGGSPAMLPPPDTPFNPSTEAEQQSLGRHLLRAMIAGAKADGHIDAAEQSGIFQQIDKLTLSADDKAFVMDELRAPLDVDAVARGARTPEEAAEIYAASLLAVDVDNAAERGYLAMLAARLKLDDKLVAHLHASVDGRSEQAA